MDSLLRWSIENSAPNAQPAALSERKDLDPGIIDAILGKPDAEQMKDDLAVALDTSRTEDERVDALDHLEMLIEQIDNANDLTKLKMWQPLQSLLSDSNSTNSIKMQTLWVIGTALQNNPAAQDAYLALDPIHVLTSLLASTESNTAVRSKVIYTLSGFLKHNSPALKTLDDEAWLQLRGALQDPDISVRRKVAFLLNTLLLPTEPHEETAQASSSSVPIHANSHMSHLANPERTITSPLTLAALDDHQIVPSVVEGLANHLPYGEDGDSDEPDADFEEKCVGLLRTYIVDCQGQLEPADKVRLRGWIQQHSSDEHRWGLSQSELDSLVDRLK